MERLLGETSAGMFHDSAPALLVLGVLSTRLGIGVLHSERKLKLEPCVHGMVLSLIAILSTGKARSKQGDELSAQRGPFYRISIGPAPLSLSELGTVPRFTPCLS